MIRRNPRASVPCSTSDSSPSLRLSVALSEMSPLGQRKSIIETVKSIGFKFPSHSRVRGKRRSNGTAPAATQRALRSCGDALELVDLARAARLPRALSKLSGNVKGIEGATTGSSLHATWSEDDDDRGSGIVTFGLSRFFSRPGGTEPGPTEGRCNGGRGGSLREKGGGGGGCDAKKRRVKRDEKW